MTNIMDFWNEFDTSTDKQWEDAFLKEVKGLALADYSKKINGIEHKPYYTANDIEQGFEFNLKNKDNNNWLSDITITIAGNYAAANKKALYALERGVESITFSGSIDSYDNFCLLLKNILVQYVELNFEDHYQSEKIAEWHKKYLDDGNVDYNSISGSISCDPLKNFVLTGNWIQGEESDFLSLGKNIFHPAQKLRTVTVDDYVFHYAGANAFEQSALSLAQAHEYLTELLQKGIDIDTACAQLQINTCVGLDYFTEIARLRAIRFLWSKIIEQYKPQHPCSKNIFLKAITSDFEWTNDDSESNIIRATTQAMSAAIAGCDSINIKPFSVQADKVNLSMRMAININHILKEESFLNKVKDIAAGSYYLDHLTVKLSEKIWEFFVNIESSGGMKKYITTKKIHDLLATRRDVMKNELLSGNKKIVGLNIYKPTSTNTVHLAALAEAPDTNKNKITEPLKLFRLLDLYND